MLLSSEASTPEIQLIEPQERTLRGRPAKSRFEPVIVGYTCDLCKYRAAEQSEPQCVQYPSNVRLVGVMCSGRLDPFYVLKTFASGADGVMVAGCHTGGCPSNEQNDRTRRRFLMMQRILEQMGIPAGRFKMAKASAAEAEKFCAEVTHMAEEIRLLGPFKWPADQQMEKLMDGMALAQAGN
jgi:F420-non-reducing hydrogenase iron-sulfur subunit